jgi:hypothetical protein
MLLNPDWDEIAITVTTLFLCSMLALTVDRGVAADKPATGPLRIRRNRG